MASKISFKFFERFRNLKSDAIPKAPRQQVNENFEESPEAEAHNVNVNFTDPPEEVFEEDEKSKKKKKSSKKSFFGKASSEDKDRDKDRRSSEGSAGSSKVNTQATGNVINIVNSKDIHWGDEYVYHVNQYNNQPKKENSNNSDEEPITKTNLIMLLLEAEIQPDHDYMDYISKNLGKNWYSVYKRLGFTQGRIETVEIDMARIGVAEARYKLLLDWVRNDDDGTLGKLANILWEDGEREIVKELAAIYHKSKQQQ